MGTPKSRQYTTTTIKRLFALSGNVCAFPGCKERIINDGSEIILSQICHIEAAEPGGERYNSSQTDDERRHFDNLILFCPNHHVITNDEKIYTVIKLKDIKRSHEEQMLIKITEGGALNSYPSGLSLVINQISKSDLLSSIPDEKESLDEFKIEDKIKYNDIKGHKIILDEYKLYQGKLNKVYEEIELSGSFKKELLLNNIRHLYLKAKIALTDGSIDSIREKADLLFDEVESSLWDIIDGSNNLEDGVSFEAIEMSLQIILVDAFMRCKILEEPK